MSKKNSNYSEPKVINALYRFFKNPRLQFYLNDLIGPSREASDKTRKFTYSPLAMYLIFVNGLTTGKNLKWYNDHRGVIDTNSNFQKVADLWNEDTGEAITYEDVIKTARQSYRIWLKSEDPEKLPRYIQYGKAVKLATFFDDFFKKYDPEIEQREINEALPDDEIINPEIEFADQNIDESAVNNEEEENETAYENEEYLDEAFDEKKIHEIDTNKVNANIEEVKDFEQNDESHIENTINVTNTSKIRRRKQIFPVKRYSISEYFFGDQEKAIISELSELCDHCGKLYTKNGIRMHKYDLAHPARSKRLCEVCGKFQDSKAQRLCVQKRQNKGSIYHCNVEGCFKSFSTMIQHKYHFKRCMKKPSSKDNYCEGCNIYLESRIVFLHHISKHTCREQSCKKYFLTIKAKNEHELVHLKSNCELCTYYEFENCNDYYRHIKLCNKLRKVKIEKQFVSLISNSLSFFQNLVPKESKISSKNEHIKPLFDDSDLLLLDENGNLVFDKNDGYGFWRTDLIAPFYGSFSTNELRQPTNEKRVKNIQTPFTFKIYTFNIYLLGCTSAIAFDISLQSPLYSYQRFDLEKWNNFNSSSCKLQRSKCSFKKNPDIEAVFQKTPEICNNKNYDRGHMTPFMNSCSQRDQIEFQLQGNLFYQMEKQNRGEWKKIEMAIPKTMEMKGSKIAHITTAVIYAKENGNYLRMNETFIVEYYYKIVFYANEKDIPFDIECFLIRQYPVPDTDVKVVRLCDIESLENNNLKFLNGYLINILPKKVLNYHSGLTQN